MDNISSEVNLHGVVNNTVAGGGEQFQMVVSSFLVYKIGEFAFQTILSTTLHHPQYEAN